MHFADVVTKARRSSSKPPGGYHPIPGGRKGGYRKFVGGKRQYDYWYPPTEGQTPEDAKAEAKVEEPTAQFDLFTTEPEPVPELPLVEIPAEPAPAPTAEEELEAFGQRLLDEDTVTVTRRVIDIILAIHSATLLRAIRAAIESRIKARGDGEEPKEAPKRAKRKTKGKAPKKAKTKAPRTYTLRQLLAIISKRIEQLEAKESEPGFERMPETEAEPPALGALPDDPGRIRWGSEEETLRVEDYEGEPGSRNHTTRVITGMVPIRDLLDLAGARGEEEAFTWNAATRTYSRSGGKHSGRYDQEKWDKLVESIRAGYDPEKPIFILKDPGKPALINEGNHRLRAAREAGLTSVPVEIRYFGHSEREGLVTSVEPPAPEPVAEPVFDPKKSKTLGSVLERYNEKQRNRAAELALLEEVPEPEPGLAPNPTLAFGKTGEHLQAFTDELREATDAQLEAPRKVMRGKIRKIGRQQGWSDEMAGIQLMGRITAEQERRAEEKRLNEQKRREEEEARVAALPSVDPFAALLEELPAPEPEPVAEPEPPRMSGEAREIQDRIDGLEQNQAAMKAANKIIRSKKLTDRQKVEKLTELGPLPPPGGRRDDSPGSLLTEDFAGRVGYPSYMLTNNNANIRRLKGRLKDVIAELETETADYSFEGGYVTDSLEDDRVQIFFDSKPGREMRQRLKGSGWRWAPSVGAWQRKRTENARYSAMEILEGLSFDAPAPEPEPEPVEDNFETMPEPEPVAAAPTFDHAHHAVGDWVDFEWPGAAGWKNHQGTVLAVREHPRPRMNLRTTAPLQYQVKRQTGRAVWVDEARVSRPVTMPEPEPVAAAPTTMEVPAATRTYNHQGQTFDTVRTPEGKWEAFIVDHDKTLPKKYPTRVSANKAARKYIEDNFETMPEPEPVAAAPAGPYKDREAIYTSWLDGEARKQRVVVRTEPDEEGKVVIQAIHKTGLGPTAKRELSSLDFDVPERPAFSADHLTDKILAEMTRDSFLEQSARVNHLDNFLIVFREKFRDRFYDGLEADLREASPETQRYVEEIVGVDQAVDVLGEGLYRTIHDNFETMPEPEPVKEPKPLSYRRVKGDYGQVIVRAYDGRKPIGGINAIETLNFKDAMGQQRLLHDRYDGIGTMSYMVAQANLPEEYRGKGYGKELYRQVFREILKQNGGKPTLVGPEVAQIGSGTSQDALRVWESLAKEYPSEIHESETARWHGKPVRVPLLLIGAGAKNDVFGREMKPPKWEADLDGPKGEPEPEPDTEGDRRAREQLIGTILGFMGGMGRIKAMTGARQFVGYPDGVSFRFPNRDRKKPNHIKITYDYGRDLFDVEFGRVGTRNGTPYYSRGKVFEGMYFDGLKDLFERQTGLPLSLGGPAIPEDRSGEVRPDATTPVPVPIDPEGPTPGELRARAQEEQVRDQEADDAVTVAMAKQKGKKTRERDNERALEVVKQAAREDRELTDEEAAEAAAFSGKGGISGSLNQYYTRTDIAEALWGAMQAHTRTPLKRVLEPACGHGVFLQTAPADTTVTGIDIDADAVGIARALHGHKHEVLDAQPLEDYSIERTGIPQEFDAVITNAPFVYRGGSGAPGTQPKHKPDIRSADQYFIDTALDHVKDDGLVTMIVHANVLNKKHPSSRDFRERVLARAEVVDAFRLPGEAFKHTHTQPITDAIILRKRDTRVANALDRARHAGELDTVMRALDAWDEDFIAGDYFESRPERVLGEARSAAETGWRDQVTGDAEAVAGAIRAMTEEKAAECMWTPTPQTQEAA